MLDGLKLNSKVFKEGQMVFSWHLCTLQQCKDCSVLQEMCFPSAEYNCCLTSSKEGRDLGHSTGALSRRGVKITFPFPIWLPYKVDLLPGDTDLAFQLPLSPQGVSYEIRESVTAQIKSWERFSPLVKRWLMQSNPPHQGSGTHWDHSRSRNTSNPSFHLVSHWCSHS